MAVSPVPHLADQVAKFVTMVNGALAKDKNYRPMKVAMASITIAMVKSTKISHLNSVTPVLQALLD